MEHLYFFCLGFELFREQPREDHQEREGPSARPRLCVSKTISVSGRSKKNCGFSSLCSILNKALPFDIYVFVFTLSEIRLTSFRFRQ